MFKISTPQLRGNGYGNFSLKLPPERLDQQRSYRKNLKTKFHKFKTLISGTDLVGAFHTLDDYGNFEIIIKCDFFSIFSCWFLLQYFLNSLYIPLLWIIYCWNYNKNEKYIKNIFKCNLGLYVVNFYEAFTLR